jgi:hypothetical protein
VSETDNVHQSHNAPQVLEAADRLVADLGDTAVFAHDVETLHERETIVFARQDDGNLLAVHEHLSPAGG